MEKIATLKKQPSREEIPDEFKWKLTDIYSSDEAWEADFKRLKTLLEEMKGKQPDFLESAVNILEVLQLKDAIGRLLDKLFVYARMHKDENNANPVYQAMTDRIQSLATEAGSVTSFIVPALSALESGQIQKYLDELPELRIYKRFLDEIQRQKAHILSAVEEKLLAESADLADGPGTIFGMLDNADLKFPVIRDENGEEVELTKGRYSKFLESPDRRVRKEAFEALYSSYGKVRNTLAATLNFSVKADLFYARTRRFKTALEASLFNDNIPESVYNQLIEVVHQYLPELNRYLKLRQKMLGLPDLHTYDLYAPLLPEYRKDYDYREAKQLALEALKPLGDEYVELARNGLESGWIDVFENEGKTSGAYAWGAYDTHPYILLNYQGKIRDVFTIVHEMGHALHSYYSNRAQPYINAGYRIFVAEVASTVNEALLMEHLLSKSTDPLEKQYLINQYLEQFRTTVFRQTMFAEFEKLTHQEIENGGALTTEWLCECYLDLNKRYYGAETVIDPEIALEWARIPHFYTGFYVYKYATGYSASIALSRGILEQGREARERYLEFLKSGDSDHPLNLLRKAGVDMESPAPVAAALDVFKKLIDEMAELAGVQV
ncbi:MAG: oligoendopeptidase F [Firmicutes bacterium]|nr:oligoendopeptidase F [Bacillota bacterium]